MHRRRFVQLSGAAALSLTGSRAAPAAAAEDRRPNILFIMVDDLGKEWISCYGAEDLQTPNIDALAKTGLRFDNAYSMPQCTPSRATLLTGTYPYRNGYTNHWDVPRWGVGYFDWKKRENLTWARLLRDGGYATCAVGKWQLNDFRLTPDAMRKHGFDDWCMWTGYESGNPPSAKRYWDPYINTPAGSKTYEGKFGPEVYTDYLLDFARKHKDEPLMLYFPMVLTHGPKTTTPLEPEATDKHPAMVRYTDHLVGRIVSALEELKIRDRTIIIFTTDNGTGGAVGHIGGRAIKGGKAKMTENGPCNPFIVSCPGLVPEGKVTDALTDFSDLFPTFCELGGVEVPADLKLDGKSIAPLLLGKADDSPREWILAMGHGAGLCDEQGVRGKNDFAERVIRDKQFKVHVNEERRIDGLWDLKADPFEETNLIESGKPEHRAALAKFQALVELMPEKDIRPAYEPRAANPWDKKPGTGKKAKKK